MKHFLLVILLSISPVFFACCGKQNENSNGNYRNFSEQLEESCGVNISPDEQRTRDYFAKSDAMAEIYSADEIEAIRAFSNYDWAVKINYSLRTGQPLEESDQKMVDTLLSAFEKYATRQDVVVYRGVDDYRKLFDGKLPHEGMEKQWDGFVSTTICRCIAEDYSRRTDDSVVIELFVPKGTHGIMMGTEKLSSVCKTDKEFLLPHQTKVKVISVEKRINSYYVRVRVVPHLLSNTID